MNKNILEKFAQKIQTPLKNPHEYFRFHPKALNRKFYGKKQNFFPQKGSSVTGSAMTSHMRSPVHPNLPYVELETHYTHRKII